MDKLKIYKTLGINETKDKDSIKSAYRTKLLSTNPEEDPDGFMELRTAYEEAVRLSDMQDEEENDTGIEAGPIDVWVKKVEACYASLSKRLDLDLWKNLLSDSICLDFDTYLEARNALISFMLNHFRLPQNILKIINETFLLTEEKEDLKEQYPLNFLNFIEYQIKNEHFIDFSLFKGADDAEYDSFINEYLDIKERIDNANYDGVEKSFDDISRYQIYYPYLEVEKLRFAIHKGNPSAQDIYDSLHDRYPDNIYISYNLILYKWHKKEYEQAYQELSALTAKCSDHYPAKALIAEYHYLTGEYTKTKEECEDLLNISSNDHHVFSLLKKANEHLIMDYEKKQAEGTISIDELFELGWCYYENERSEDCRNLIKEVSPDEEHRLEFYNLFGRVKTSLHEFEEALPLLRSWEQEIVKLVDDGTIKYKKRKRRYVLSRYLQALCLYELSQIKTEEGDERSRQALDTLNFDIDAWDDISICMSCHSLKAQILLDRGMYRECVDVCLHAISLEKSYFPAYIYMQRAYEGLKDAQMVIDIFYQAIEVYADYVKPYTLAAKIYFYVHQYEDSKRIIQMAKDRNITEPELEFLELKVLRYSAATYDQTREMIPLCDNLIQQLSENESKEVDINDVYYEKIYAYMDIEEYKNALDITIIRLKACTGIEEYYRIHAKILYNMNNYKKALPLFETHIKENENDESYLFGMAVCYERLGQVDKAINTYSRLLDIDAEHYCANNRISNIYYNKIKNAFNRKDYEASLHYALCQLEINQSAYYYIEGALVYTEGYEFEKAVELLNKAMEIDPDNVFIYNNLGWVYQLSKRNEEAASMYLKAIELNSENQTSLPYLNLSDLYLSIKEYDKAYALLQKCKEHFPDLNLNKSFGSCLERSKKYDAAMKVYKDAIKAAPDSEAFYTERLALCCEAAGRYKEAKKYHKRYMVLKNADTKSNINLGDFYLFCAGKYRTAHSYYKKALLSVSDKNSPAYFDCLLHMAEISYLKNGTGAARLYFDHAMSYLKDNFGGLDGYIDYPSYKIIHIYHLFRLHYYAGRFDTAIGYMKQLFCDFRCTCCDFNNCKEALFAKAYCHMSKHEYADALECLKMIKHEDSSDTRLRFELKKLSKKH